MQQSNWNGYSAHTMLLPYIEQGNLFARFAFNQYHYDTDLKPPASIPALYNGHAQISAFICLSDLKYPASSNIDAGSGFELSEMGWNNYGCSEGASTGWNVDPGLQNGFFRRQSETGFGEIPDGLSNTIMMAEFNKGGALPAEFSRRSVVILPSVFRSLVALT